MNHTQASDSLFVLFSSSDLDQRSFGWLSDYETHVGAPDQGALIRMPRGSTGPLLTRGWCRYLHPQCVDLGQQGDRHPSGDLGTTHVGTPQRPSDFLFTIGRQTGILPGKGLRTLWHRRVLVRAVVIDERPVAAIESTASLRLICPPSIPRRGSCQMLRPTANPAKPDKGAAVSIQCSTLDMGALRPSRGEGLRGKRGTSPLIEVRLVLVLRQLLARGWYQKFEARRSIWVTRVDSSSAGL